MPFDQRSLIHGEVWFLPCFVRQNQPKNKLLLHDNFRQFSNKDFQIWDHFFPLLFLKDSESLKILDIQLREVGEKICLNGTSKVNRQTNIRTNTQTDISTYRKNRPRGPMHWKESLVGKTKEEKRISSPPNNFFFVHNPKTNKKQKIWIVKMNTNKPGKKKTHQNNEKCPWNVLKTHRKIYIHCYHAKGVSSTMMLSILNLSFFLQVVTSYRRFFMPGV